MNEDVQIFENHPADCRVKAISDGLCPTEPTRSGTGGGNLPFVREPTNTRYVVRRITPKEAERLQGFPTEMEANTDEMTSDELIKWAITNGDIIVDCESGTVYGTRGPGGNKLKEPKKLGFRHPTGYIHVNLSANGQKKQVRVHRIVYIAAYGDIPEGYVIDHINTIKDDNRISNLQALKPEDNSHKAKDDGCYEYLSDETLNPRMKVTADIREKIFIDRDTDNMTYSQLADKYHISKSRVAQLIQRRGYTDIPWKDGSHAPDSHRYKALGNSMAVPVMRWIAQRIDYALAHPITEDTSEPIWWQPELF